MHKRPRPISLRSASRMAAKMARVSQSRKSQANVAAINAARKTSSKTRLRRFLKFRSLMVTSIIPQLYRRKRRLTTAAKILQKTQLRRRKLAVCGRQKRRSLCPSGLRVRTGAFADKPVEGAALRRSRFASTQGMCVQSCAQWVFLRPQDANGFNLHMLRWSHSAKERRIGHAGTFRRAATV